MRSRPFLALATALALAAAAPAEVKPEGVSFESADGVDLQGTFYPSKNGGGSASVIIMHGVFKDPGKGDWAGLAVALADEGYNVLRFDFRGHGKSTELKDKKLFWETPANVSAMKSLAGKNPPPKSIGFKDFQRTTPSYFPMLANDLMAARIQLDLLNDKQRANSSSVYLIGPEDTMTLGMIFMAAEWTRPNVVQQGDAVKSVPWNRARWAPAAEEAGKDIAASVWLSPVRNTSVPLDTMKKLVVNAPKLREENQMLFISGAQDAAGVRDGKSMLEQVLIAKGGGGQKVPPLKFTTERLVAKSGNVGVDLLGKNLGTEKTIIDFINSVEKDRKNRTSVQRYPAKPPIIDLPSYGIGQ